MAISFHKQPIQLQLSITMELLHLSFVLLTIAFLQSFCYTQEYPVLFYEQRSFVGSFVGIPARPVKCRNLPEEIRNTTSSLLITPDLPSIHLYSGKNCLGRRITANKPISTLAAGNFEDAIQSFVISEE